MNKFVLFILLLITAACLYLWVEGKDLHVIQTEIDIAATPEKVWAVLSDVNAWHEWSPIINHSEGEVILGATLSITMIGEKEYQDGPKYHPRITRVDAPYLFQWQAIMLLSGLMTNYKVFELQATPTGTRLIHTESFQGMVVPIFRNSFDRNVPTMLNVMNEGLKEELELRE